MAPVLWSLACWAELDAALELIDRPDVRLLTLTGIGGIGKTRLALELAARLDGRSRVIELAAITDPERVMPAIGAALGVEDVSEAAIAAALDAEPLVLFLDNFEQVLPAAAAMASLLSAATTPTLVVTSRAPLRIGGEHELPLPPLASDPAVELFVRRAEDQDPRFAPDRVTTERIAEICTRLDGLPLAIELAAARTRVLTPAQILDRIADRLDLLTGGRRDAPERHRTLRATIAWSYELLEPAEQRLMAELAVFRGGWSLEACEAVAEADVLDALSALVDHSLVVNDGGRFTMLEMVREYAVDRLRESGETEPVARRHALWCASLAESAEPAIRGAEQSNWYARLDSEQENLRAAAAWGIAGGDPEVTMRINAAVWRFWLARGAAGEARDVLRTALASGRGDPELRAKALNAAGVMAGATSDFATARALFEEALVLGRQLDDPQRVARPLMNLGLIAVYTDDYDTALKRYAEAGEIWQSLGDAWGESSMYQNRAIVHGLMGRFDEALPLIERSVELARATGDQMHIAQIVVDLAKVLVQYRPDDPRIPALMHEGLELCGALGERRQIIECLEVLAALSARKGAPETGAELIGAAAAERERAGAQRMPDERPIFDAAVRELEDALGADGFARARERGHEWTLDQAIQAGLSTTAR